MDNLDLSANTKLSRLELSGHTGNSKLNNLNLPVGETLKYLLLRSIDLTDMQAINLNKQKGLTHIDFGWRSGLKDLNISELENISYLSVYGSDIDTLDVSKNKMLRFLNISETPIKSIDLSANTNLEELKVSKTAITQLDLKANTKLKKLNCEDNNLTKINLKNQSELSMVYLKKSAISSLSLNQDAPLKYLDISGTNIKMINLTGFTDMCDDNITTATLRFDGVYKGVIDGKTGYYYHVGSKNDFTFKGFGKGTRIRKMVFHRQLHRRCCFR